MAVTPSNMLPLGTIAPEFSLIDVRTGRFTSLTDLKSDVATVVMFISNHCPYVKHIQRELVNLCNEYMPKNIQFIAICANDAENYPEDSPAKMKQVAETLHYPFPYLHDENQSVAKAYQTACTPDFYIFDKGLHCIYRGRMDESTPGNSIPVTGKDLRAALDAVLGGKPVSRDQHPSIGCNIKWKK